MVFLAKVIIFRRETGCPSQKFYPCSFNSVFYYYFYLDIAGVDDIEVVSLVALLDDDLSGHGVDGEHCVEDVRPLVLVQVAEQNVLCDRLAQGCHRLVVLGNHLKNEGKKSGVRKYSITAGQPIDGKPEKPTNGYFHFLEKNNSQMLRSTEMIDKY